MLQDAHGTGPLFDVTSNTKTNMATNHISIYPNPASQYFQLEVNTSGSHSYVITLLDISGRLQFKKRVGSQDEIIQISHLKHGMYYWKIENENERFFSGKMMIGK